jgi:hypothetical protein
MSIRAICRTYHHSHHTVGTALNNPQPRPYTRTKPTAAPVLGPFMPIIEQILLEDGSEPAEVQVDKYQTVRFETNRYSVPRRQALHFHSALHT